jgi:hypothetical protein
MCLQTAREEEIDAILRDVTPRKTELQSCDITRSFPRLRLPSAASSSDFESAYAGPHYPSLT